MANDQIKVDVKVTGQPEVAQLEKSIQSLKEQVKELDKQFDSSTGGQAGYGKARADLTSQIREQEELLSKLNPGGGGGSGLVSTALAGASVVSGAAATFAAGSKFVNWAAPDVFAYQIGQFKSIMVDVKQTIGEAIRNFTFGAAAERTVTLETEREQTARRIKDLDDMGKGRSGAQDEELRGLRIRAQRLEEGLHFFEANRVQPTVFDQARGQELREDINRLGLGDTLQTLHKAERDRMLETNQTFLNARDEFRKVQEERERLKRDGGGFPGQDRLLEIKAASLLDDMEKTKAAVLEKARTAVGLITEKAFAGFPEEMQAFIGRLKQAGLNVDNIVKDMDRVGRRNFVAERARQEARVQEDIQRQQEDLIEARARAMGVDKLMPQQRDIGTEVSHAARQAGVDAEHATQMGIRAIDDKFHQTIRALDDLESNIKARNALAEMLPQMRQMAARQAHVGIDARMIQNALEEATGAIAEGAYAAPAVYNAMNRQVIRMRANAREMRRFGHMFNQMLPQFPQNGGNF